MIPLQCIRLACGAAWRRPSLLCVTDVISISSSCAQNAGSKAGLTLEKARHRAEEYAQELKHMAQEKMHAAQAEL